LAQQDHPLKVSAGCLPWLVLALELQGATGCPRLHIGRLIDHPTRVKQQRIEHGLEQQ
jgi:hypothetical protein